MLSRFKFINIPACWKSSRRSIPPAAPVSAAIW